MSKKNFRPVTLLIIIVVLSSLLTISASGSFFYRNAVLGYETQKTLLLNLNLSYTYLLTSMQESSKKYLLADNTDSREEFFKLVKNYSENDSINLNFDPISELQASVWLSNNFVEEKSNMNSLANRLDFKGEELSNYQAFLYNFNQIVARLSSSVESKDKNIFTNRAYSNSWNSFNYYMIQYTSSYVNRVNASEDKALKLQNTFGFLSLLFSLILAAAGAFVAYFAVLTNRNNSYYRKLFTTTFDTADFGLAILNSDYKYKYMNNQYKNILSLPDLDFERKTPVELLPEDFTSVVTKPTDFEDGLINSTFPITIAEKQKHINVSRFAIKDENGQTNFVSIIRDFTDLVCMETKLKDQLAEIEFHSKAKDTFIANVSHEIKTPLNAIIGLSHVLNTTELSIKQKAIVSRISSSSELLLNLINDVLDFSKIKNSNFKFYPTNILLTNLLSEIEGIATALIGEKNVLWKTEYKYNPDLCIYIDKTRLTQILLNLINNASKFTTQGYIKLFIESLEETSDSVLLKFSVEDTGLGMDSKDLVKLFQEFEQLENHLTKQHQGTGLGLIICKNVIESMGGRIWVESKKDKGSKFFFTLPAIKASPDALINSFTKDSLPTLDGEGKRVLVVEDNEINYEVTESLLAEVNIICDNAQDGEIALELCKKAPEGYYQLILMDIHMPNMDGYTASRILKNDMKIKTPIIALSATNVEEQIKEEYKDIIDAYIPKPFRCSELYKALLPYFNAKGDFSEEEAESLPQKLSEEDRETLTQKLEDPFADKIKSIENLGGLESLYDKHLNKFKQNYSDSYLLLEKLLFNGEIKEAHRLAHSIKGLAGTLGLPFLEKASAGLEAAIINGEPDLKPFLSSFKSKLDAVCKK